MFLNAFTLLSFLKLEMGITSAGHPLMDLIARWNSPFSLGRIDFYPSPRLQILVECPLADDRVFPRFIAVRQIRCIHFGG